MASDRKDTSGRHLPASTHIPLTPHAGREPAKSTPNASPSFSSHDVLAVGEGEESRGEGPSPLEAHSPYRLAPTRGGESPVAPFARGPGGQRPPAASRLLTLRQPAENIPIRPPVAGLDGIY